MTFEPERECMDRGELQQLQLEQLQAVLARVYLHVPFYRRQFDLLKVDPDEVRSLDDVRRLPFTTRRDLQDNYPYGMFAVPLREVVRIHASTCMSCVVGYTRNDIKHWSNLVARVLVAGGVGKDDVVQIAYGYNLSTGGFGMHYGAERVGASVIPTSTGNTARQLKIMRDFKTTALVCTPTYALRIADAVRERNLGPGALSLKYGLFGGEPWSEELRAALQERLHIVATDNYGLSEVIGPGVACECQERHGLHINEDHFFVEVVNPRTLEPVPAGETGELVVTTLTKEAFPVIRFRTRDLTRLLPEPCPCGRKTVRMARVTRRSDDVLIVRGVKVDPQQIGALLAEIEGAVPPHQIVIDREGALDSLTLQVEAGGVDEMRKQYERVERIRRRLTSELGLSIHVKLVEHKSIAAAAGKSVLDRRTGI